MQQRERVRAMRGRCFFTYTLTPDLPTPRSSVFNSRSSVAVMPDPMNSVTITMITTGWNAASYTLV